MGFFEGGVEIPQPKPATSRFPKNPEWVRLKDWLDGNVGEWAVLRDRWTPVVYSIRKGVISGIFPEGMSIADRIKYAQRNYEIRAVSNDNYRKGKADIYIRKMS